MAYGAIPFGASAYGAPASGPYQPSWGLSLQVLPLTVQPSWGLRLQVCGTIQPSWGLRLQVLDQVAMLTDTAHGWGYQAEVGGADLSARLVGPMRVRGEEGLAATATWSIRPASGPLDPTEYVGADVGLEYVWRDVTGVVEQIVPMFQGVVDGVAIDAATGVLTYTAVDRRAEILAAGGAGILPGSRWSAGVFEDGADALQQQEDRLTTLCASFDIGPTGAPTLTDWAAKSTPDWSIGEADYVWGSLSVALDSHTNRVQRVNVEFDYRFTRLRLRELWMQYRFGGATALAADPLCPPSVAMIEEALAATGLELLEEPQYIRMSQEWYDWGGTWHQYPGWEQMVLYAQAFLGRRFAQSVDEQYRITVDCATGGIDPRRVASVRGAIEATFDAQAWEADALAEPVLSRPYLATEMQHDATTDASTGRAAADEALATLLAQAKRAIRTSHRGNRITFSTRLNPFITRARTVYFNAAGWEAQGKVYAVEHTLNPEAGPGTLGASTTITLAISRPSLPNPTPSALTAPAAPDAPDISIATQQAHRLDLGNHIGGKTTSPPWDEATMAGWIVNLPSGTVVDGLVTRYGYADNASQGLSGRGAADALYPSTSGAEGASYFSGEVANPDYDATNLYPAQFRVLVPEVEEAARDNLTAPVSATYLVDVPEDLFTYTAP